MQLKKRIMIGALIAAAGGVAGLANPADAALNAPRKIVAVLDGTQTFGTTQRAINYYDVTDVTTNGGNLFNQTPLFSVWTGYEIGAQGNYEDPGAITVNPANGDTYVLAYDSGSTPGQVVDGDTEGDYDLYRIDYQSILNDFVSNSRPAGTMYAPALTADGIPNPQHPSHFGTTVNLAGITEKVGEVGRTQGTSFFDYDIEFVDAETLALLDNEQDSSDLPDQDHELRVLKRVSTSPGAAVIDASDPDSITGGYNAQTTESWESNRIGLVGMDVDALSGLPVNFSEPVDIAVAKKNGIVGVWVTESDGGGDDLSFYEIPASYAASGVFATASTIDGLGVSRGLDESPEVDPATNDGEADWINVDADGNLVIGESNYFESVVGGEAGVGGNPAGEPTVLRLNIDSYAAGAVTTFAGDAWDDLDAVDGLGPVGADYAAGSNPAFPALDDVDIDPVQLEGPLGALTNIFAGGTGLSLDDDANVTDGRFVTLDKGANLLYIFDLDSGGVPNVVADVYVIDLNTGEIVYEELNAINHFMERHGFANFLRGDIDGNGVITAADIDAINVSAALTALEQEEYDLTGDDLITGGGLSNTDTVELVRNILGTEFGDANLDGNVNIGDLTLLAGSFGSAGGWANGDFTGDGTINIGDLTVLAGNFGFTASPTAVPEPASLALLALGGLALIRRR